MNEIDKVIELLKENYDEATLSEWLDDREFKIIKIEDGKKIHCFKPKEVFPKVFEDENYKFEIWADGSVEMMSKNYDEAFLLNGSLELDSVPLAYEVLKQAMELKNKESSQ